MLKLQENLYFLFSFILKARLILILGGLFRKLTRKLWDCKVSRKAVQMIRDFACNDLFLRKSQEKVKRLGLRLR